jgi:hypothetical protein
MSANSQPPDEQLRRPRRPSKLRGLSTQYGKAPKDALPEGGGKTSLKAAEKFSISSKAVEGWQKQD